MNLVIVESPAKAKTINKYLGSDFKVLASFGHVRDLPAKDGSVRPDEDFAMTYEIDDDSVKHVAEIVRAVRDVDTLYLATDPDREGEAISWHVLEALKQKKALGKDTKVFRVVFNEITKRAVTAGIANPREIDMALVNAQQARRALDYLVGFTLSPILWRKLPGSKSAGRVQSVALRLICEREEEIEKFITQEYWDIEAKCLADTSLFSARLTHLEGQKLDKFAIPNAEKAEAITKQLQAKSYTVKAIEPKQSRRNPQPPFTTSTLQQEAARKLGFGAKKTMQIAQKLYEGIDLGGETVGLITYMRTDGVQVAEEAIQATRGMIATKFGNHYVPKEARRYQTKAKNAQEAHEAIRPTDVTRAPDAVRSRLDADQLRLYELIWKRMVASQMESAVLDQVAVDIASSDGYATLRANGSVIKFDGFLVLYREGRDDEEEDDDNRVLPPMTVGQQIKAAPITPRQHFTEPPPRYSEASLVKKLEELGIGRPSTYASIISVLQERQYVVLDKKRFVPEERGRIVTSFLLLFFPRYVQYDFTADLENQLDVVSSGEMDWKQLLRGFWTQFSSNVEEVAPLTITEVIDKLETLLGSVIFPAKEDGSDPRLCPVCNVGRMGLRLGKFGAFAGCSNYPDCRNTRPLFPGAPGAQGEGGEGKSSGEGLPRVLGENEDGLPVTIKKGPYGIYAEAGNGKEAKRVSLPQGMDPLAIDLDTAKKLLALPREVGLHPETSEVILAGIGRYGPYLLHQKKYSRVPAGDDVLYIGLNRAVDLISQPAGGRGGREPIKPLRELGAHPETGDKIAIYDGRYGPYVKAGKINATLPDKGTVETLTVEEAVDLLAARAAKGGKKGGFKKSAPKAKAPTKAKAEPKAKAAPKEKKAAAPKAKAAPRKKKAAGE